MRHGKRLFIATFLLPPLLLYGIFVVSPYAQAFQISTTDWGGLSPDYDFVGLDNFARLLGDDVRLERVAAQRGAARCCCRW